MLPLRPNLVLAAGDRLILIGDAARVAGLRDQFDPW
jgi:hypothetical protein